MSDAELPATPEQRRRVPVYKLGESICPFGGSFGRGLLSREFPEVAESSIAVETGEELPTINFTVCARKLQTTSGNGRELWIVANQGQLVGLGETIKDPYDTTGAKDEFVFGDVNARVLRNLAVKIPLRDGIGIMVPDRKKFKNGQVVYEKYSYIDNEDMLPSPLRIAPMNDDQLSSLALSFHLLDGFMRTEIPADIVNAFEPRPLQEARAILQDKRF